MWKASAASIVFTPDEPTWLAGYAARIGPARGTVSDLRAKALALEDDAGQRLVILSVDLIAVQPEPITSGVAEHLLTRHGLQRPQVLMAATHTHYGPEIRPDKALFFNIPPKYAARIEHSAARVRQAMCQAADRALVSLQPAELSFHQGCASFAHNRRAHSDTSKGAVTDHQVSILHIRDSAGRALAILFGYACHNTTIPLEDLRYSGDWAGFAQDQLERDHPGCCALFLTGAAADQDPFPRGSVELSQQHGQELASAVAGALASPGRAITPSLRMAYEEVALPLQPIDPQVLRENLRSPDLPTARKARFLLEKLAGGEKLISEYPAPFQAIRLGDELLLLALSGEPVNDYAHRLQSEFRTPDTDVWVAGYCNDMFGYLPTRRIQQEGG